MKPTFITVAAAVVITGALASCRREKPVPPGDPIPKVVFVLSEKGVEVGRDYNQRVLVGLKNEGPGTALLRLKSDTLPDLPSGFVGRGTDDWEVPDTVLEIPPGEIWHAPLLVHANLAQSEDYALALNAWHQGVQDPVATGTLKVHVATPKLTLETAWLERENAADRARLQSTLRIRNAGPPVGDLSVHFEAGGKRADHELQWHPVVEAARLPGSDTLDVVIGPVLYPGFVKLEGEIVIRGLNQELRLPYVPQVPAGKAIYVTLSRTTERMSNNGTRCTNRPHTTYDLPPVNGTPSPSSGGYGGGFSSSTGGGGRGMTPSKPPEEPEPPPEEEDDGFGFLGVDPAAAEPAGEAEVTASEKGKGEKDNKADAGRAIAEEATPGDAEAPDEAEEGREISKLNDGILDLMDMNSRAVSNGTMRMGASGLETGDAGSEAKPGEAGLLDDHLIPLPFHPQPEPAARVMRDDFGRVADTISHKDEGSPPTHVVRRTNQKGDREHLDFSFGIQPGVRKRVPVRMNHPISQPRLGPSPVKDGHALAAYTKPGAEGGTIAEVLEPNSGKRIELSPPGKAADTPVVVRHEGGVDAIHREDGVLKRTRLNEDLTIEPSTAWPAGEETGPILAAATRPDGKAVLLTRDAPDTMTLRQPEGTRELPGRDGSIGFTRDGPLVALRRGDGSVGVVDGSTGETRHSVPGSGHGAPSLVSTNDGGMRLTYAHPLPDAEGISAEAKGHDLGGQFAADFADSKWSDPKRLFLPESPVRNAAVAVEFTPPFATAHYKPMDIAFSINGRKIADVEGRTPSGRYLYRVPASSLNFRTTAGQTEAPGNQVTIDSKGIGPGNFHVSQKCSLYSLHDWKQACFVAGSEEEAESLAQLSSHDVRHSAHDLVLASNGTELPRSLKPGESTTLSIGVFNAGDRPSPAVSLQTLGNDEKTGAADIPSLPPFTGFQAKIGVTAPASWVSGTPLKLNVAAPSEQDADPETNSLDFYLFRELDPGIAGPTHASAVDLAALPADAIMDVGVPPLKEHPFEAPLRAGRVWFRSPIPTQGDLQLEVTGPDASVVGRLDLFDEKGKALEPAHGQWAAMGEHVYLRVGLPENAQIDDSTRIRLWWE